MASGLGLDFRISGANALSFQGSVTAVKSTKTLSCQKSTVISRLKIVLRVKAVLVTSAFVPECCRQSHDAFVIFDGQQQGRKRVQLLTLHLSSIDSYIY